MAEQKIWECPEPECNWYTILKTSPNPNDAVGWDQLHIRELEKHRKDKHGKALP